MKGYQLVEGQYINRNISESEKWDCFEYIFSSNTRHSSTYKYIFLYSIISKLESRETRFTYKDIFETFVDKYWILIHNWKLKQSTSKSRLTEIEKIIKNIELMHECNSFYELPETVADYLINDCILRCKKYVVGALFEDTKRLLYSFSNKDLFIIINPIMADFIIKHKPSLESILYYELSKFILKVNDEEYFNELYKTSLVKSADQLFYAREIVATVFENKNSLKPSQNNKKQTNYISDVQNDYDNLIKYKESPEEIIRMIALTKGIKNIY